MKRLALIALVLAMVVGVAGAAPITYEEPFDGASDGTDKELSEAGWNAHGLRAFRVSRVQNILR